MLYLTARAVGQMKDTRNYLEGIEQDGLHMPKGPIICSPNRTFASLIREVVRRKPQVGYSEIGSLLGVQDSCFTVD